MLGGREGGEGRHGWASRGTRTLTMRAAGSSPARNQASGPSRGTVGGDVDGLNGLGLTDFSVQFDEHEVIGVAGMGIARMGDGFDPLEQLLSSFINGRQGMVAETNSVKSIEDGADYQPPRPLCPYAVPSIPQIQSQPGLHPIPSPTRILSPHRNHICIPSPDLTTPT